MIGFQSTGFLLFSFMLFVLTLMTKVSHRKILIFAANIVFCGMFFFFKKKQLGLLFIFIVGNYSLLRCFETFNRKKLIAFVQIVGSLAFLSFYKYELFQIPLLNIFPRLDWFLKPATFAGISFFSFRLLSLVFDSLYGARKKAICFIDFFNYLFFFPCYLSGPLDRYDRFVGDCESKERVTASETYEAVYRIVWGSFKKLIIADTLHGFSTDSFHAMSLGELGTGTILFSHYIYVFVLYFDFSGYSDIAIGISRLLGIKTPENFDKPFSARNVQEFWNKWHITFLHWLRDYIYIPVQRVLIDMGIKNFVAVACFSYMAVFIIAGVWHGDSLDYLLYGIYHGLAFTVFILYKKVWDKNLSKEQKKSYRKSNLIKRAAQVMTFHYFYLSLFLFIHKRAAFAVIWERIFG